VFHKSLNICIEDGYGKEDIDDAIAFCILEDELLQGKKGKDAASQQPAA
jgi:hypothetical protein